MAAPCTHCAGTGTEPLTAEQQLIICVLNLAGKACTLSLITSMCHRFEDLVAADLRVLRDYGVVESGRVPYVPWAWAGRDGEGCGETVVVWRLVGAERVQ